MILDAWRTPDSWVADNDYDLKEADILEAYRFFYLFFDSNDIEDFKGGVIKPNGSLIHGKAIQVNLSVAKGGNDNLDLMPWMRGSSNSTYMTITMYTYDTIFYNSIMNFREAEFTLINAMISSTTNEYDINKAISNGYTIYSKDLRDKPEKKDILTQMFSIGSPNIPEPMYYNMKQQDFHMGDIYCINSLNSVLVHYGHELIDDNTRISIMNTIDMDTLEPKIRDKLSQVHNMKRSSNSPKVYDSLELSSYMLFQDFESMQSGYTYIYDSQMGENIIKVNPKVDLPFRKYQFEEKMVGDLERSLLFVKRHCKSIEKEYGSIRLQFTPLLYGDKLEAYFKDWNKTNQPVLKDKIGIDNENKLKDEISEVFNDLQSNGEYIEDEEDLF